MGPWKTLLLGLLLPTGLAAATFNVTSYGAIGDGATNDTAAIQAAIQAAKAAGGGTVLIPPAGASYLSDSLTLASGITFTVSAGAMLQMEPYGAYDGGSTSPTYFIIGTNLSAVTLNGGGVIDGQGAAWWAAFIANSAVARPPAMIRFANCTGVTVAGITIQNSPMINQSFYNDSELLVSGETVFNPYASASNNISPNTDGMDVTGTNIRIENCTISTGDDVIALGTASAATHNVTITGCTFGTGHGLSIGSHTAGGVAGLWVDHCTFTGTQYGLRFKSDRGNGGLVTDAHYSDLTMTGIVYYPIYFDSYYGVKPAPVAPTDDPGGPATLGAGTPQWQGISFTNINASCASGAKGPLYLWGLPEAPATNVLFDNVSLNAAGKDGLAYHAQGISFTCSCRINGAAVSAATVVSSDATLAFLACPAPTATPTPTASPAGGTSTPSATPTRTASPTFTVARSATATLTPTVTVTATIGRTPSGTATPALSTFTPTPSALPSRTRSPLPTESASPTSSDTPSATGTVTPFVTATPSPTGTMSPTVSVIASFSATPSPRLTPSATASMTQSPRPTVSATLSPSPAPAASASAVPTEVGGPLDILASAAWPDPDPQGIKVHLDGPADHVDVAVWSVALRRLDQWSVGPTLAGWVQIPLRPGFLAQAGPGAYYYSLEARRGVVVSGRRLGTFYRLR